MNMLKFLTNKLRTQSINENNYKDNEDRDSGTESDDEIDTSSDQMNPVCMDQRVSSISPADTGCSMESPGPDQQDAHSSEEELEVINNSTEHDRGCPRPLRSSSSLPEKRKWSQRGDTSSGGGGGSTGSRCSSENEENVSRFGNLSPCIKYADDAVHFEHSSDEEVHTLLGNRTTPVQFRTSPPLEAVKPRRMLVPSKCTRTASPPPKLLHYEESPRKRTRHARHVQRPYLDFEKMQQLRAKSATPWKKSDQSGELSLYCW